MITFHITVVCDGCRVGFPGHIEVAPRPPHAGGPRLSVKLLPGIQTFVWANQRDGREVQFCNECVAAKKHVQILKTPEIE